MPNESNLREYGDWTEEDAAQDEAILKSGGADFMKLEVGRNIVRFIPPKPGVKPFEIYFQHFINKPDGSRASFACPNRIHKKPCPVCEHANKLQATGNQADLAVAKSLWPRKRVLGNVIDRKDPDGGPKVLGFPKTIHEKLTMIRQNPDVGGNFLDPVEGFDICIERVGTTKNDTEYTVIPSRNTSPLGPSVEVMNEWIEAQFDLTPHVRLLTPAQISEMISLDGSTSSHQGLGGSDDQKQLEAGDDEFGFGDDNVKF